MGERIQIDRLPWESDADVQRRRDIVEFIDKHGAEILGRHPNDHFAFWGMTESEFVHSPSRNVLDELVRERIGDAPDGPPVHIVSPGLPIGPYRSA